MSSRKKPGGRPFALHWGSGNVAEEARHTGEHHVPSFQLLKFTDGEAAGSTSVRFCYYDHHGRFQRGPLILNESDIEPMRKALQATPELREFLRRLGE